MYGIGSHLSHVTKTIGTNFRSRILRRLYMNLSLIGPVVLEEMFENVEGRMPETLVYY